MTPETLRPLRTIRPALCPYCERPMPVGAGPWTCPWKDCGTRNMVMCPDCQRGHLRIVHGVGRG